MRHYCSYRTILYPHYACHLWKLKSELIPPNFGSAQASVPKIKPGSSLYLPDDDLKLCCITSHLGSRIAFLDILNSDDSPVSFR